MSYIDSRNSMLREVHSIYSNDISDFICGLSNLTDLDRINEISKNNGVELSRFNTFPYRYTRLDHSVGVAIILEHFGKSRKNIAQAIFHEVNKPAFAFSADYLKKYFKIENFIEPSIFEKIVGSDFLFEQTFKDEISLKDISSFKRFYLGFSDFPKLSASNLEYILTNGYGTMICDSKEIADLYNNLYIEKNEIHEEEFAFTDLGLAKRFFKLSLEIGKKNRSYEAKITKQLISDVLMLMVRRELIELKDLYNKSDIELIKIGMDSSDKRIQEGWAEVQDLHHVYTKFTPTNDVMKYCVKVDEKSLYVDPLVKTKMGTYRLSEIDSSVEHDIEFYKATDTDMYMYIDYEL